MSDSEDELDQETANAIRLSLGVPALEGLQIVQINTLSANNDNKSWAELLVEVAEINKEEDSLMEQMSKLRERKKLCIESLGVLLERLESQVVVTDARMATSERETSELEAEREKNVCIICMNASRNALILPCSHFLYCNPCIQRHQTTSNNCPTCRGSISAVLQCRLTSD